MSLYCINFQTIIFVFHYQTVSLMSVGKILQISTLHNNENNMYNTTAIKEYILPMKSAINHLEISS